MFISVQRIRFICKSKNYGKKNFVAATKDPKFYFIFGWVVVKTLGGSKPEKGSWPKTTKLFGSVIYALVQQSSTMDTDKHFKWSLIFPQPSQSYSVNH